MTIRARTPTSSTVSIKAVISLMLKAETSTRIRYRDTIATKMLMAEDPLNHLKAKKMMSPRRSMSRTSAMDISRNPKSASSMIPLYISAQR